MLFVYWLKSFFYYQITNLTKFAVYNNAQLLINKFIVKCFYVRLFYGQTVLRLKYYVNVGRIGLVSLLVDIKSSCKFVCGCINSIFIID